LPELFADRVFKLVHISAHSSLHAYICLRRALLQCTIPPTWFGDKHCR